MSKGPLFPKWPKIKITSHKYLLTELQNVKVCNFQWQIIQLKCKHQQFEHYFSSVWVNWEWKIMKPLKMKFLESHLPNLIVIYLRTFESSPRRSFFSLVRSPCARSALITPAYASNSRKRKLFYQDRLSIFYYYGYV